MPKRLAQLVELGNKIRRFREKKGISQEALADLSSLHRTYVGGVERGERNISFINILKISKALGVDAGTLVSGLKH